jgi:deoxyadenosine/deoxycytidine kinase
MNTIFKNKLILSIEGNIGSGKSSVVEMMNNRKMNCISGEYTVSTYPEPVKMWKNYYGHNLLELQYKNPLANSLRFQLHAMDTFNDRNTYVHMSGNKINLMERSLHTAYECFLGPMYEM